MNLTGSIKLKYFSVPEVPPPPSPRLDERIITNRNEKKKANNELNFRHFVCNRTTTGMIKTQQQWWTTTSINCIFYQVNVFTGSGNKWHKRWRKKIVAITFTNIIQTYKDIVYIVYIFILLTLLTTDGKVYNIRSRYGKRTQKVCCRWRWR